MGRMYTYFLNDDHQPVDMDAHTMAAFAKRFTNIERLRVGEYLFDSPENEVTCGTTVRRAMDEAKMTRGGNGEVFSFLNPPVDISHGGGFQKKFLKDASPEKTAEVASEALYLADCKGYMEIEFYFKAIAEDKR